MLVIPGTESATHTLESVVAAVGPATPEDRELFNIDLSPAELVEMGRQLDSRKILTDGVRWAGQVYQYALRTPPAKLASIGISLSHVRVFVADVVELDARAQKKESGQKHIEGIREVDVTDAESKRKLAKDKRETLRSTLTNAALRDKTAIQKVDSAYGTMKTDKELVESVRNLAALGKEWLSGSSIQGKRLKATGVTLADYTAAEKVASDYETAQAKASGAAVSPEVVQAELDQQDGRVLSHMAAFLDLTNTAHAQDPTVPKLIPIATRSFFLRRAAARNPAETTADVIS